MRPIQGVGALLLALCSGAAMALGLGDIRVLSKPGQPLVAEIPVISSRDDGARAVVRSSAVLPAVGVGCANGPTAPLPRVRSPPGMPQRTGVGWPRPVERAVR